MNEASFRTRMMEADRLFHAGALPGALIHASALRRELDGSGGWHPEETCWALYYELRCLHGLEQWAKAVALMEAKGAVMVFFHAMNRAHSASLMMECSVRAGRSDLLVRWARECFQSRLETGDLRALSVALRTALCLASNAVEEGHPCLRAAIERTYTDVTTAAGRPELASAIQEAVPA